MTFPVCICVSLGGLLHQSFVVGEDSYRSNGYISNFRLNAGDPAGLNSLTLCISHQFAILFCCRMMFSKIWKKTRPPPPTMTLAATSRPTYYCNKSFQVLSIPTKMSVCWYKLFDRRVMLSLPRQTAEMIPSKRQKVSHFQDAHIVYPYSIVTRSEKS